MRLPPDTENHSPQQQCEYNETIIIPQEPVHPGDPSLANTSSLPNQNIIPNFHTSDPTCLMPNTTSNTTLDLLSKSKGLHFCNLNVRHIVSKFD